MCSSPRRRAGLGRGGRPGRTTGLVLALLAVGLAGCGKKGDPEPPLRLIPRAATDLTVRQRGSELILRFGYPSVATSGMALPGLAVVELWQALQPVTEPTPTRPPEPRQFQAAAALVATLEGAALTAAVTGDRIEMRWPAGVDPAAGEARQLHSYGVRFVSTRGERSGFSNLAAVAPLPPPAPPRGLNTEGREDGVEVSWRPPEGETAAFRVYRRRAEERTYGEAVATVEPGQESFLDATARYGNRYIYTVTAVVATDPLVESAPGAEREIDYRDRFPPPPPGGLVALAEAGQVRLSWRASEAPDAAGYHVYRRDRPGAPFTRRTAEPVTATRFLDAGLTAAGAYAYRVTTVDGSGNESPPSAEVEATAR